MFFSTAYAFIGFVTLFLWLIGIGAAMTQQTTGAELLGDVGKAIFFACVWPIALPIAIGAGMQDDDNEDEGDDDEA